MTDRWKGIVLAAWLLLGAYVGCGGWVGSKMLQSVVPDVSTPTAGDVIYNGISFANEQAVVAFVKEQNAAHLFPWVFQVPDVLLPLITALAFGLVGGAAQQFGFVAMNQRTWATVSVGTAPVWSCIVGALTYLLCLLIPMAVTTGDHALRPEGAAALALMGGLFSTQAYQWVERNVINKLFHP